jgi:hypothetical protein
MFLLSYSTIVLFSVLTFVAVVRIEAGIGSFIGKNVTKAVAGDIIDKVIDTV